MRGYKRHVELQQMASVATSLWAAHTLNTLDLLSSEACQCTLVLGPGDAGGRNGARDIDQRGAGRRAPLPHRYTLGLVGSHLILCYGPEIVG